MSVEYATDSACIVEQLDIVDDLAHGASSLCLSCTVILGAIRVAMGRVKEKKERRAGASCVGGGRETRSESEAPGPQARCRAAMMPHVIHGSLSADD